MKANRPELLLLLCLASISSASFAQERYGEPAIVWSGPSKGSMYQALSRNTSGIVVKNGEQANENEVQVRAGANQDYVEVKNKKMSKWISMVVPRQGDTGDTIDLEMLLEQAFQTSNCDLVKTILDLNSSTPEASVHFNSQPVGNIKSDGRFYYESEGVCRNSKIEILASLKHCKDFVDSFKAIDNPQTYKGKAVLDCTAKKSEKAPSPGSPTKD